MITPHLIQILKSDARVTALVQAAQIYPTKLPQNTSLAGNPSAIKVKQRAGGHLKNIHGREGTAYPIFDVVGYADDQLTAEKICKAFGVALDCYSGTVTVGTDSVKILGVFQLDDEDEDWMAAVHADEVGRHVAGAGFKVWHTEQT